MNSPFREPQEASSPVFYGYWLIGVAFVAQLVAVGVTNYVAGPFMAPMVEELGWTRAEYTIPRSLGMFVMAGVGFVIGALVDRHGGRRFMLLGTLVCSASLWLLGQTETLLGWIVVNGVLLTAGAGLLGNLVVNVTLAKWFVERRGFAVALAAMGVSFAGIAVTPAVTWAIEAWGWRSAWEGLAVASFLVAAPVALFVRRTPEDHGLLPDGKTAADAAAGRTAIAEADLARSMTRRQALSSFAFYALIGAFGLFTINIVVVLLHAMPWLDDEGFTPTLAAQMIVVTSIPAMLAKPVWGFFIDRLQAKPLGALGSAVTGSSLLLIVAALAFDSLAWTTVGFFLLGIGWGGMIPIQEVIWAGFFGRRHLGAVRSAAMPFSLVFGAAAPLLVAFYRDSVGDYTGAMIAVAAANLMAAILMLAVKPPQANR